MARSPITDDEIRAYRELARGVGDEAGERICNVALSFRQSGILNYMTVDEARELCARACAAVRKAAR